MVMSKTSAGGTFLNGVPELLVLRLLARQEMYGYELVRAIRDGSGGEIDLAEGVVYPVLHGLERAGQLAARRQTVDGRSRVYYRVTPAGLERLGLLEGTWRRLQTAVEAILTEPRHA